MKKSNIIQMHRRAEGVGRNASKSSSHSANSPSQVSAIRELISPFTLQPSMAERKGLVGIITNSFESPYFSRIVEHTSNYLSTRGYHSIVQSGSRTRESELDVWLSLVACKCDGFILHSDSLTEGDLLNLLDAFPKSVLVNCALPKHQDRCIYLDNKHGGKIAAAYLKKMGHKDIAMVTGLNSFIKVRERSAGFLDELGRSKSAHGS